jgi:hypothetical protein
LTKGISEEGEVVEGAEEEEEEEDQVEVVEEEEEGEAVSQADRCLPIYIPVRHSFCLELCHIFKGLAFEVLSHRELD